MKAWAAIVVAIVAVAITSTTACGHLRAADPSAAPAPFPVEAPPPPARMPEVAPPDGAVSPDAAIAPRRDGYT